MWLNDPLLRGTKIYKTFAIVSEPRSGCNQLKIQLFGPRRRRNFHHNSPMIPIDTN